ncbi:group 1 glycosyl transferase [Tamlana nanhaiensis]|uniref:Group 1 glycosyl transferase n=1 Tax=Neotamlana nanhaiensis TaxID=1382798 RepID=A0A0D7W2V1_9FLAO|nr:glycosyltransferase [Tamlana nanhaiensis]KJD33416.1 group 1 glycosyl transferase [Tamlana nanhaiensis]
MRVLQLIDSLETGGAERVAVNLANALSKNMAFSAICATRKEGLLKKEIKPEVKFLFLAKTKTIDVKAVKKLNSFIKSNQIEIIHAHSSSFFLASIIKLFNSKIKIVWHDHYGNAEFLEHRNFKVLKVFSRLFSHIFTVNTTLETWVKANLKHKNVSYLPNFATLNKTIKVTQLAGESGMRIVCLANFRAQKDHVTLINAFKEVVEKHKSWTLHCVGKSFNDNYYSHIKSEIEKLKLEQNVFLYEQKSDVYNILTQCEIGVLSSKSEGLPIAILEYGIAGLAVVATNVGEIGDVILNHSNGVLVNSNSVNALAQAMLLYIENEALRLNHAKLFSKHIEAHYSEASQTKAIIKTYKQLLG